MEWNGPLFCGLPSLSTPTSLCSGAFSMSQALPHVCMGPMVLSPPLVLKANRRLAPTWLGGRSHCPPPQCYTSSNKATPTPARSYPLMVSLSIGPLGGIFFQTTTPRLSSSSLCNLILCKTAGICHHTQLHHPCLGSRYADLGLKGLLQSGHSESPQSPTAQHPVPSSDSSHTSL